MFNRKEDFSSSSATFIRLSALLLAGEIDEVESVESRDNSSRRQFAGNEVGDMLREVAAGVTWLESRHTGETPAIEMIMLLRGVTDLHSLPLLISCAEIIKP